MPALAAFIAARCARADLCGVVHQCHFGAGFEQALLVQQVAQLQELMGRLRTVAYLRTHAVDPADQLQIEVGVAAEVVVARERPSNRPGRMSSRSSIG